MNAGYVNSPETYIPLLINAGYKFTKPGVTNQLAKYDESTQESQVIYLSEHGTWKVYGNTGQQISHGSSVWELRGVIL